MSHDSVPPISESAWAKLDDAAREEYLRRFHEISYERHMRLVQGQAGIAKAQGAMAEAQSALVHKMNSQRFEFRAHVKRVDQVATELSQNTEATARIEEKVDELTVNTQALVDLYKNATAVGSAISWSADWGKRLAWVLIPMAFLGGAGITAKEWIKGMLR